MVTSIENKCSFQMGMHPIIFYINDNKAYPYPIGKVIVKKYFRHEPVSNLNQKITYLDRRINYIKNIKTT